MDISVIWEPQVLVALYVIIAGWMIGFVHTHNHGEHFGGAVIMGVLWPLFLPLIVGSWMAKLSMKVLR